MTSLILSAQLKIYNRLTLFIVIFLLLFFGSTGIQAKHIPLSNTNSGGEDIRINVEMQVTSSNVVECPELDVVSEQENVSCFEECDGIIWITNVVNGVEPFTYSWSNGESGSAIDGLCAGEYSVTIIDANECEVTKGFLITQPTELFANAIATDETTSGANDGTATANPEGGTAGYTYLWSNGETGQTIDGLEPGEYGVTVTDENGCTDIEWVLVQSGACPELAVVSEQQNVSCFEECNGVIWITGVVNGVEPFTYTWSNGEEGSATDGLCAGEYGVTIVDANGCEATAGFLITQPAELFANASATNETTSGANDGTATASPEGGTPEYTFLWSNGETGQTIDGLEPGEYGVTVTDENGCTDIEWVLVQSGDCPELDVVSEQQNVSCSDLCDGIIWITGVVNGVEPFSYSWSNGEEGAATDGLCAGEYAVTIVDANGCEATAGFLITQPEILLAEVWVTNETGNNANDGTATAEIYGGTPEYTYEWSNGETGPAIDGLEPGLYWLLVTDENGCVDEVSFTVEAFDCPELEIVSEQENSSCFEQCDGVIWITNVINGTEPYTYSWSNGEEGAATDGLCAGEYGVTIVDAAGCEITTGFLITQPTQLVVEIESSNETASDANDGSAFAIVEGGTEPYEFAWSNGASTQGIENLEPGEYAVTVTDANGCIEDAWVVIQAYECGDMEILYEYDDVDCFEDCNGWIEIFEVTNATEPLSFVWNNGVESHANVELCPGEYVVTVTDANNCQVISNGIIIEQPAELLVEVIVTGETSSGANDGTATAVVSGGTPEYSYEWSNGETGPAIDGLEPGWYWLVVIDENGCVYEIGFTVEAFDCNEMDIIYDQQNVSCFEECNGYIIITEIFDGEAPFSYQWTNGETGSATDGLCAGEYAVTIVDNAGCELVWEFLITQPDELIAEVIVTNETGNDLNDGTATAVVSGGTPEYTYEWSNGESGPAIDGLAPGEYFLVVTDENACIDEYVFVIESFGCQDMDITYDQQNVLCFENCSGFIFITEIFDGEAPYEYLWSNGETGSATDGLCAGEYAVTISDNAGCESVFEFLITQPEELIVEVIITNETGNDLNDGTATAVVSGGTPEYAYLWSNGETGSTIDGLEPGQYWLVVTDENGCVVEYVFVIQEYGCQDLEVLYEFENVSCFEECDGILAVYEIVNGEAPFSYSWSNGADGNVVDGLCAGEYLVTVVDNAGCTVIEEMLITQPSELFANATSSDETSSGANNGTATANPEGGTPGYSYQWSNGETTQTIDGLAPGEYGVTVTDENACTDIEWVLVESSGCPELEILSEQENASCFDVCDGIIIINGIINGEAPFNYSWSNGDNSAATNNLCAGEYGVTIVDASGCELTQEFLITQPNDIQINVLEIINYSEEQGGAIDIGVSGEGFNFYWTGPENFEAETEDIDGLIPGCYTVEVSDPETDCSESLTICIEDLTSSFDHQESFIELYPNPANQDIWVELPSLNHSEIHLIILDENGKIWGKMEGFSNQKINIKTSDLPNGFYYLKINWDEKVQFKKLAIIH